MASGLFALLDDIAALTKLAAASLDDVGAAAGRAGAKAAGVVIDDAAVTPRYVAGLSPARELPIIGRIALGSIRNKLLILLPAGLLLSSLAPWAVTPLLMFGGAFLCFEGAEKVIEAVGGHAHQEFDEPQAGSVEPADIEKNTIAGAVRTDLILSAEIMAIAIAQVATEPLLTRALVLIVVAIALTVGVYGVVALIVKLDDIGLYLAQRRAAVTRAIGRGLVAAMPIVMDTLSVVGLVAMLWVGGGILLHGAEVLGWATPAHLVHDASEAAGHAVPPIAAAMVAWLVTAAISGVIGLAAGLLIAGALHLLPKRGG